MKGSEGLGRNATDRGRKWLKVSLICYTDCIVKAVNIGKANTHDTKLLLETIDQIPKPLDVEQTLTCLCDAGYVGKNCGIYVWQKMSDWLLNQEGPQKG